MQSCMILLIWVLAKAAPSQKCISLQSPQKEHLQSRMGISISQVRQFAISRGRNFPQPPALAPEAHSFGHWTVGLEHLCNRTSQASTVWNFGSLIELLS